MAGIHLMQLLRTALGSLALAAALTAQVTVTVPCSKDNTLYESATGALSNGAGIHTFCGVTGQPGLRRTLSQFNVAAAVPAGARILTATIQYNISRSAVGSDVDMFLHRVNASWGEGSSNAINQEGTGASATNNDATWIHRFYPSQPWTTPGGDFRATPSSVFRTTGYGTFSFPSTSALVTDVQSMLDNPTSNFGWLIKTNEQTAYVTRRLDSRENSFPVNRPVMTVTYMTSGTTAVVGTPCPSPYQALTLAASGATSPGTTTFALSGGVPGGLAAVLLSLELNPAGTPLFPFCPLYLPLGGTITTQAVLTLSGTGTGSTSLTVPASLGGVFLAAQAAAVDALPVGYTLSNAAAVLMQ